MRRGCLRISEVPAGYRACVWGGQIVLVKGSEGLIDDREMGAAPI